MSKFQEQNARRRARRLACRGGKLVRETCVVCGGRIAPRPSHNMDTLTCSVECRRQRKNALRLKHRACTLCGIDLIGTHAKTVCPDCRLAHRRATRNRSGENALARAQTIARRPARWCSICAVGFRGYRMTCSAECGRERKRRLVRERHDEERAVLTRFRKITGQRCGDSKDAYQLWRAYRTRIKRKEE